MRISFGTAARRILDGFAAFAFGVASHAAEPPPGRFAERNAETSSHSRPTDGMSAGGDGRKVGFSPPDSALS